MQHHLLAVLLGSSAFTAAKPLVPLFSYEELQLKTRTLQGLPQDVVDLFSGHEERSVAAYQPTSNQCKVFPGDKDWPRPIAWNHFSRLTGSKHYLPAARVCYNNGTSMLNQTACDTLAAGWRDLNTHFDDPIEMFSGLYEGLTCLPPAIYDSGICTQGGYPVHTVNVSRVDQIQLAVNFARNTGLRLVIKNTGHDFNGKSGGSGSLSLWLHYLKDITYIPHYKDANYSGPAFKAGAGVQVFELYAAARAKGMLAEWRRMLGMAADQALGFEVVTADGKFVTANAKENSDLFWALRGGGGGTFGVVTSVIVKVYPDVPVTTTTFIYTTANGSVSLDKFWAGARAYLGHFKTHADWGMYSYFYIANSLTIPGQLSFWVRPFFAPNKSVTETKALLEPFFDELATLGISVERELLHFNGFEEAWNSSFTPEFVVPPNFAFGSRLWPRQNWDNDTILNATFDVIKANVERGYTAFGFNIAPTSARGGYQHAAVNPAWRNTLAHIMTALVWPLNSTKSQILAAREDLRLHQKRWIDLSPGAGSYLNEGDRLEPNFQHSFYGSNNPALLEIKRRRDPWNVFWAVTAVGSEAYEVRSIDGLPNENGRLCRTTNPSMYVAE